VIHSPCHMVCELQLFYMDVNVAEFFVQLVLMMYTNPFTVHIKLTVFLGTSPNEHQFYILHISVAIFVLRVILSLRMRHVFWSLLTYIVCNRCIKWTLSAFTTALSDVGLIFDMSVIPKRTILHWYCHCDWRLTDLMPTENNTVTWLCRCSWLA
jgi:hypothetical protein